ncbi:MAG: SurA N-terminal domain-containing protein [Victivallaceae bacterium]|nr:SurA N-terminal domain-containing protein [Victivallaceae bacterium]
MVIGKINSVFAKHHRWLFGVIVMVIVVTFVFYFSTGSIFDIHFGGNSTGIKIFDEKVSEDEFKAELRAVLIETSLDGRIGVAVFGNEEAIKEARRMVPQRLAMIAMAERRGIRVSDEDIDRALVSLFSMNGKFDQELLNKYLANVLTPVQMTVQDLRNAMKSSLMIAALNGELAETAMFSGTKGLSGELSKVTRTVYKLSVVNFKANDYLKQAAEKITEDQLKSYYEANLKEFEIPAEYEAVMAVLPYDSAAVTKDAAAAVSDAALEKFFNDNPLRYADKDNPAPQFATVRNRVVNDYIAAAARQLANAKANDFSDALYQGTGSGVITGIDKFRADAAKRGFLLKKANRYNAKSAAVTFDDGSTVADPSFVNVMCGTTPQNPLTYAFSGNDGVYIGYVSEVAPKSTLPFEDVRKQIAATLSYNAAVEIAREKAKSQASALAAIPYDQRASVFDGIGKAEKVELPGMLLFNPTIAGRDLLAQVCTAMEAGDVSDALPTEFGAQVARLDAMTVTDAPAEEQGAGDPLSQFYFYQTEQLLRQVYLGECLLSNIQVPEKFYSDEQ